MNNKVLNHNASDQIILWLPNQNKDFRVGTKQGQ